MEESPRQPETELVDVTEIALGKLRSLDDSTLSRSLRRLVREAHDGREAVAGFQSAL
ncbi:MAG TPA: FxSxx-COOH cyclophane-containing RiPP peptide [Micromonosporaceae bacterium]|nr:FxSxx-COOH cyclophane-containing RiPP peptide [Micromonosporaceae bacterium]